MQHQNTQTMTTTTTTTLQALATELNGKYWQKGNLERVYLNRGYNTKKMATKCYVYQADGEFKVSVFIECEDQPLEWIKSQQELLVSKVLEEIQEAGLVADQAEAAEPATDMVQGYCLRWHEVKVAINRFGKLDYRKRQKVHTYQGSAAKAPAGFIALTDEQFAKAVQMEAKNELFAYGEVPQL